MQSKTSTTSVPDLSVVISMLNPGRHLKTLLPQLEGLNGEIDHEVVFVDDGSTDGSTADLAERVAQTPHWRLVTLSDNGGPGPGRNCGMAQASGRYIYFFDVDDKFRIEGLRALIATGDKFHADLVIAPYQIVDGFDGEPRAMHPRDVEIWAKLRDAAPGGSYTLEQVPDVLMLTVYNHFRILRRSFVERTNFRYSNHLMGDDLLPHWLGFLNARRLAWSEVQSSTYVEWKGDGRISNYDDERRLDTFATVQELKAAVRATGRIFPELEELLEKRCFFSLIHARDCAATAHKAAFDDLFFDYLADVPTEILRDCGGRGRSYARRLAAAQAQAAAP